MIQVTYDTQEDYDVEYGFFKRMYMYGSYDEVLITVKYIKLSINNLIGE